MYIDSSGIYETAEKTAAFCGSRDPFRAAQELGIYVDIIGGFHDLLGMFVFVNGERHILLNNGLSSVMSGIVCAHELGHDALHRKQLEDCRMYCDANSCFSKNRTEYEANAFAAHFLIGNSDVTERLPVFSDIMSLSRDLNTEMDLLLIKLNEMKRLGFDVNVPLEADGSFLSRLSADSGGKGDGFSDGI